MLAIGAGFLNHGAGIGFEKSGQVKKVWGLVEFVENGTGSVFSGRGGDDGNSAFGKVRGELRTAETVFEGVDAGGYYGRELLAIELLAVTLQCLRRLPRHIFRRIKLLGGDLEARERTLAGVQVVRMRLMSRLSQADGLGNSGIGAASEAGGDRGNAGKRSRE